MDLWAVWNAPHIPVWCGGRWPNRAGLRRAAKYDGAMPTFADQKIRNVPVEEFAAAASFLRRLRPARIDIAVEGATRAATAAAQIAPYAAVGATWWIEACGWWRGGCRAALARIADGPPSAAADL
jgi:hypothetical protein